MAKGKFWAVMDMKSHSLTFCESEMEAESVARSLARRQPLQQFAVLESLYAFAVEQNVPVTKLEASEIVFGDIEF